MLYKQIESKCLGELCVGIRRYLKVLDKKNGVEMFVLKVTKSEDRPELNKIPIYY